MNDGKQSVGVTEARRRLSKLAGDVARQTGRLLLTRRGSPVAALVTVEDLRRLERMDPPRVLEDEPPSVPAADPLAPEGSASEAVWKHWELSMAHHRLRSIIDSTGDSICAIDASFRLLVFNEAYARGYERRFGDRPAVGTSVLDAFRDAPQEAHQARVWWTRALRGEAYQLLRESTTPSGEKLFYDVRFSPLKDDEGHQVGAVSVTRDITVLKRAEEALRRYNNAVTEANQRLEQSNFELQQSNRELREIARVASHDLQEPLRKVTTFAGLLRSEYAERMDDQARFYIDRLDQAARRMSALIHDLLAFTRIRTRGRAFRPVDLSQVLDAALRDLDEPLREAGGRVEADGLCHVEADPQQMQLFFRHLIENAIKFRRPDVPPIIRISAQLEAGAPETTSEPACILTIQDNGIGFDQRYADRIFQPFERLQGKFEGTGTGIGLAIVRRIVERHGGQVEARGVPGEGSMLKARIPLTQRGSSRPGETRARA